MRKLHIFLTIVALFLSIADFGQLTYPTPKKTDQTDNYFGTVVADPYRWMENDNSEEVKAWVEAENKVTFDYLSNIPYRNKMQKRMEEVANYERYTAPFRKGSYFYYYKNDGLQNQNVLYRQKGLNGKPEVVLDPNKLSSDGTTRLLAFSLSKNGDYAVIGLSKGGSDWQTFYVRDMVTGKNLADSVLWVKVSGVAWQGKGFYYSRYPAPEKGKELTTKNENHQVWYHTVGTSQDNDKLVYEDKNNPQRFHTISTSEDERFAFLTIRDRGKGYDGNSLFYLDSKSNDKKFMPIVPGLSQFYYNVIDNVGDNFLIMTNDGAPNNKLMLRTTKNPDKAAWQSVIPEKPEPLQGVSSAGGHLFASYLKDVTSRIYEYDMNGKLLRDIKLPGLGTANGFGGNADDKMIFYTFNSFTVPPTIYRYDIADGKTSVFRQPKVSFDPNAFEVKQVFYPSKDGTRIPMFIVHKKGLVLNGANPTILYGYGGFNISTLPNFSATLVPWLEQGGVYASANLRGGSEYGQAWHEAGMKLNKQNVFDDFIAAGEYLIKTKYTSKDRLAIRGGSNGGLLVGAVMNQRPDLARVAIPQVGVMDMLRFHKFTIGWNWIADYGSSDSAADFKNLYAYSPLHNIKPGVNYPATIITTADHDDRVVPAHSFKYTATLQSAYKGDNPILIRIDTNSGHGASNTKKQLEQLSDIYCFTFYNMGITPVFKGDNSNGGKKGF